MKTFKQVELRTTRIDLVAEDRVLYDRTITTPFLALQAIRSVLPDDLEQERFVCVALDIQNRPLAIYEVARGGIDTCPVDVREVFRTALVMGASNIIVSHCHPSGISDPSDADISMTRRLTEAGKLLGVKVLDHLICGRKIVSMASEGYVEF